MEWAAPSGPVFTLKPPRRVREYLDGLAHALAPVAYEPGSSIDLLLEWCAAHAPRVTLDGELRAGRVHWKETEKTARIVGGRLEAEALQGPAAVCGGC